MFDVTPNQLPLVMHNKTQPHACWHESNRVPYRLPGNFLSKEEPLQAPDPQKSGSGIC